MIALPGIRFARVRHLREVEAIAHHPACRGFLRRHDGKPFDARKWFDGGASFFLFEGGWLGVVPREADEVYLHVAVLPGYRGAPALTQIRRVIDYLLDEGSPIKRAFGVVSRHNRAVRHLAQAAGMKQTRESGEWVEFVAERSA